MDDKKLNTIVEGLYPLVKRNSNWITKDKLGELKSLLELHNYYEGSLEDLRVSMSYTYLDKYNFYFKNNSVKESILKDFKELFEIYCWLRHTSTNELNTAIFLEEVLEVVTNILNKLRKDTKVYFIKDIDGLYKFAKYIYASDRLELSNNVYNKESIRRVFIDHSVSNRKPIFRYATREEVEQYLTNLYGVNPENLHEDVILEYTFKGD